MRTTPTADGGVAPVEGVTVDSYTVPTATPVETDGTHTWSETTAVVVHVHGGGRTGLGYTYGHPVVAALIRDTLAPVVVGRDLLDVPAANLALWQAARNLGRPGIAAHAISAVDVALWDLKARMLDIALADLLGRARASIPVYGSGGFCNYRDSQLRDQLAGWVDDGIRAVKMKVGREWDRDPGRVAAARAAIGDDARLMVDANGAYGVAEAIGRSHAFAAHDVTWHEEPVSSDDLAGLARVRDHAPPGMETTAGEYAYDLFHVRNLIEAEAVDCIQADVTRCGGITGFLDIAAMCWAHGLPLSSHGAPQLSVHVGVAAPAFRHLEYFHDHVRVEALLFEGITELAAGSLAPDRERPGLGIELRTSDAAAYAA